MAFDPATYVLPFTYEMNINMSGFCSKPFLVFLCIIILVNTMSKLAWYMCSITTKRTTIYVMQYPEL